LPVLISDKVNIWREVGANDAGLVAPDTLEGTRNLLREWLSLTPVRGRTMSENARELFRRQFTVDAMATGLVDVITRHSQGAEIGV
jgi:glycosyltransferase involved in cell wall biosynthesis